MTEGPDKQKAIYDADKGLMRIIASFFVVLLHASGIGSTAGVFYNALSRFSIPAFVVISGYYMLGRKDGGRSIGRKCLRLFLQMVVWAAVYYGYSLLWGGQSFAGIRSMLIYLLTQPYHLWYCWAAVMLYLLTPPLRIFCQNAEKKDFHYALGLTFVFGCVVLMLIRSGRMPTLEAVVDRMKAPYMLGFVCLYLFGGYLRRYGITRKGWTAALCLAGLAGTAVTFVGTLRLGNDLLLSFFAPNAVLAGAGFFLLAEGLFAPLREGVGRFAAMIRPAADCTLGVYLLHPLILMRMEGFAPSAVEWVQLPLRALIAFSVSLGIVFLLKKIPLLKKLV